MSGEVFVPGPTCSAHESLCFHPEYNWLVTYQVVLGGHAAYLVIMLLLKFFMKATNSAAFSLKYPMMLYNLTQVTLSVLMAVNLAPYLKNKFFNVDGQYCAKIEFWILVHFATKFLDMFDSFFMILRKKEEQLSFLHVYHHCTIGLIWGMLLHFGVANGTAFFGAWINSVVHALMYFHYFWTSIGMNNPFKQYLTLFQMFQFGLCILQAILVVLYDTQIPQSWAILQLCYHATLLYLFYNFFMANKRAAAKAKLARKSAKPE